MLMRRQDQPYVGVLFPPHQGSQAGNVTTVALADKSNCQSSPIPKGIVSFFFFLVLADQIRLLS